MVVNSIATVVIVLVILWLALKSGQDHPGGVPQPARRARDHGGARLPDGRAAQPDLDRLRGAVRRPRRRLRHPVQRALSRRPLRRRRSEARARARGAARRRAADARGRRGRGRLPVVPADRLSRRVRARPDRRHRHADRVSHQHHAAAGAARRCSIRRASRSRSASRSSRRSTASWSGIASRSSSAPRSCRSAACRCSITCSSTSIRSTCATRRSSRSRPSSICARDPTTGASSINVMAPSLERRGADRRAARRSCPRSRASRR